MLGYVARDMGLLPAMQSNAEGYHMLRTDWKMAGHDTELLDMASLWVCACVGDGGGMYNVCVYIHTRVCVYITCANADTFVAPLWRSKDSPRCQLMPSNLLGIDLFCCGCTHLEMGRIST